MSDGFIVETDEKGNILYFDENGVLNRVAFQEGGQVTLLDNGEMLVEQDGKAVCYRNDCTTKFVKDNEGNTINYRIEGKTVSKFTDKDGNSLKYWGTGGVSLYNDKEGNSVAYDYDVDGKILYVNCKEDNSSQYSSDKVIEQSVVMQKKASEAAKNAESIKENGQRLIERVFDEFWDREPSKGSVKAEMKNQAMSNHAGVENPKAVAQGMRYDLAWERHAKDGAKVNESAKGRTTETEFSAEDIMRLKRQNENLRG